jgi:hypothetical protein
MHLHYYLLQLKYKDSTGTLSIVMYSILMLLGLKVQLMEVSLPSYSIVRRDRMYLKEDVHLVTLVAFTFLPPPFFDHLTIACLKMTTQVLQKDQASMTPNLYSTTMVVVAKPLPDQLACCCILILRRGLAPKIATHYLNHSILVKLAEYEKDLYLVS